MMADSQEATQVVENVANLAHPEKSSKWILDSGASQHVTGMYSEFNSYTPYPHTYHETIQIADGTSRSIRGVGTVQCTPFITLSSVLYVPSFPVNLVSISALVDHIDYRVTLDRENCLFRKTDREETWDWNQA